MEMLIGFGVLAAVAFVVLLALVALYNRLVTLRNQAQNAWAQIDVQLKRRHDLVPNLVETVRGYATHERSTLESVIQARSHAVGAGSMPDRVKAEQELGGALGRLLLIAEQYPELKANTNFLALQEELSSTENKIGFARQHYNDSAMSYNTGLETFPGNLVAGAFRFERMPFFEIAAPEQREAPKVKF